MFYVGLKDYFLHLKCISGRLVRMALSRTAVLRLSNRWRPKVDGACLIDTLRQAQGYGVK